MEHVLTIQDLLELHLGTGIVPTQKPIGNTSKRKSSLSDRDCDRDCRCNRCRPTRTDECACVCKCDCSPDCKCEGVGECCGED
jgi:hypothetical protein